METTSKINCQNIPDFEAIEDDQGKRVIFRYPAGEPVILPIDHLKYNPLTKVLDIRFIKEDQTHASVTVIQGTSDYPNTRLLLMIEGTPEKGLSYKETGLQVEDALRFPWVWNIL